MTKLTPYELNQIIVYTGLDILMLMPDWSSTPVVHYSRDKRGTIQFVTILRPSPLSRYRMCKREGSGL